MRISALFALAFLLGAGHLAAQSISPSVIASAGGSGNVEGVTIMWTVGELAVTTLEAPAGYLTQGFHQPTQNLVSAPYETAPTASLDIWPNPTTNALFVSTGDEAKSIESVELVDMIGRPVLNVEGTPGQSELRLDVSAIPSGTYLVRLKSATTQHSSVVTIQR